MLIASRTALGTLNTVRHFVKFDTNCNVAYIQIQSSIAIKLVSLDQDAMTTAADQVIIFFRSRHLVY